MTWTANGDPISAEYWFPTLAVGDVLLARPGQGLAAWKAGDDAVTWTRDVARPGSTTKRELVSSGDRVATTASTKKAPHPIVCCNVSDGADAWTAELDLAPTKQGLAFSDHGLLVRGATDAAWMAVLDPKTGEETARVKVPGGVGAWAAGKGIFLPGFRNLTFLDDLSSEPREIEARNVGTVLVDGDTVLTVTGTRGSISEATLSRWAADGSCLGQVGFPTGSLGARLVALGDGRVAIFPGPDHGVIVADPVAGAIVWEGEGREGFSVPGAALVDGKLVAWLRADDTVLRTWDAASGAHLDDLDIDAIYALAGVRDELVLSSGVELRRLRWSEGG